MGWLENKVALITGASSGVGTVLYKRFLQEGALVFGCGTRPSDKVQQEPGFTYSSCDITSWESAQEAVQKCISIYGRLDILVNNAGVYMSGPIETVETKDFEKVFRVNVFGTFHLCKAALPELRKSGGCIINIVSELGIRPVPQYIVYPASKAAVIQFSKCLAIDSGPDVRVNCIAPALMDTPMVAGRINSTGNPEEFKKRMANRNILKRMCVPEDVAGSAVFLASDDASFITGHVLGVCAGGDYHYW